MNYCHARSYRLRYTDFDFRDEILPSSILALAQESAASSADELGFGYEALKPLGYGFITVNTYCELLGKIGIGDELTVETWPLPPRHVIFERDYRIKNQRGEIVAALASRWCLIDLPRFSMLPPTALGRVHENCPYRAERTVDFSGWKIARLGGDKRECYRMTVRPSHCDHYFHANNTKYADFFFDCFSMEERRAVRTFQIAYARQAKAGNELCFYRSDEGENSVLEALSGGELVAQCRVRFEGERR